MSQICDKPNWAVRRLWDFVSDTRLSQKHRQAPNLTPVRSALAFARIQVYAYLDDTYPMILRTNLHLFSRLRGLIEFSGVSIRHHFQRGITQNVAHRLAYFGSWKNVRPFR